MPTVADLMTLHADSVAPFATLAEAAALMVEARISSVVVVDAGRVVGILTERDMLHAMRRHEDQHRPVAHFMTAPVHTVNHDTEVRSAFRQATRLGIRHLVVTGGDGRLLGIVSETDFRRFFGLDFYRQLNTVEGLMDRVFPRLPRQATLDEALAAMETARATSVVVVDGGAACGIVTERDVVRLYLHASGNPTLGEVMTQPLTSVLPETSAAEAAALMLESRIRHLTVVDAEGRLLGLLTEHSLIRPLEMDLLDETISEQRGLQTRYDEALLIRNAAMTGMLRGERLAGLLELIALSAEHEVPGIICSIMLADADGSHLHVVAAPGLAEDARALLAKMPVAEGVGVSGTAAWRRGEAYVENIHENACGIDYRDFARRIGVTSGWAEALLGPDGRLLGTFAVYREQAGRLPDGSRETIRQASRLAALLVAHQQQAEELGRSQQTFRELFESAGDALFVIDGDGRCLDANPAAERMTGFRREELRGHAPDFLAAQGLNDLARTALAIRSAAEGAPQELEFWGCDRDGRVLLVRLQISATQYAGKPALIVTAIDISVTRAEQLRLGIERDLANALNAEADPEALLATMLDLALRYPEFDSGGFYWQNPGGDYELRVHKGLSPAFVAAARCCLANSPRAEQIRSGKVLCSCLACCQQQDHCRLFDPTQYAGEGLRCLITLPIIVNGRAIACLNLAGHRTSQISVATCQAVQHLVRQYAMALERIDAREAARQSRDNLGGLFASLDDLIFVIDAQRRIVHYNPAVDQALAYAPGVLGGEPVARLYPAAWREQAQRDLDEMFAGRLNACPAPLLAADGRLVQTEVRAVHGHWNGEPALIAVARDVGERLAAEERLRLAASVFANAHEGIMITDVSGHIVEVNPTFSELTGYSRDEAIGQNAGMLNSGHHDATFYRNMWEAIRDHGHWRGEVWNRKKSGEIFVELLTISAVRDAERTITHFVGIFSDITLLKEHQQRLERLAHFDALTQLPNRMLLADRLQLAMANAARSRGLLAVCYLDLDGFKPINDRFGHAAGDHLLVEVAQRLRSCVRGGDTVARLGGDEFVLLLSTLNDLNECDQALNRISASLTQPFPVAGESVTISASIGVTLYPHDGSDADTLLRHADQAMYVAKQAGRNRHHLFDPEKDRRARRRREDIARIGQGLAAGEFVLHYQPKVDMRQGRVVGAEALIRWQHPQRGLLLPQEFLPAIEGNELAIDLGNWVITTALDQLSSWAAVGVDLKLSINIAGEHLQHPGFAAELGRQLAAHPELDPSRLELEVLETAAIEDVGRVAQLFTECRQFGVSFALDDFGTGYSSLTYFRRLPAEILKIDQSFVRDMLDDPEDLAIVEGVIGLTRAFRRQVIAEGVESIEHGLVLLLLGCDLAQGFGIARPMAAEKLPQWMAEFRPDELWAAASAFTWAREDLPMLIAEVDHRRWMKALEASLAASPGNTPAVELDHHACGFGRWYQGPGRKRYGEMPTFVAIDPIHQHLHQLARQMFEQHQAGCEESLAESWQALHAASRAMSELLQQLQAEILIGSQTSKR